MQTSDKFITSFEHSLVEFGKLQSIGPSLLPNNRILPMNSSLGLAVGEIVIAEAVFVAARGIR